VANSGKTYNACGECGVDEASSCTEFVSLKMEVPGPLSETDDSAQQRWGQQFLRGIATALELSSAQKLGSRPKSIQPVPATATVVVEFDIYASQGAQETPWDLYRKLSALVNQSTYNAVSGPNITYAQDCEGQPITSQIDLVNGNFKMTDAAGVCVLRETLPPSTGTPSVAPSYAPLVPGETRGPTVATGSPTLVPLRPEESRAPTDTPSRPPVPAPTAGSAQQKWSGLSVLVVALNSAFSLCLALGVLDKEWQ